MLSAEQIELKLPPLHSQQDNPDPTVHVRFYDSESGWNWYAIEYDPAHHICFGLVVGFETELGYFTLAELDNVNESSGYSRILYDKDFQPVSLSELA